MALPSGASAIDDCSYATGQGAGGLTVYTDEGRTEDSVAGVCLDTGLPVDGGYAEVGAGDGSGDNGGVYAVIDGSDANPDPVDGYGAISTYESGSPPDPDSDCNGIDEDDAAGGHDGPDENSGGCLWLKPLNAGTAGVPLACGNTSGADWANTNRDGCSIP